MENLKRIAVVQASPALFNMQQGLEKVADYLHQAAQEKVQLVLFPEAYLPGYPRSLGFGTVVGSRSEQGRLLWQLYYENSLRVGDQAFQTLSKLARQHQVYLVIGVIEQAQIGGTLFCTMLYFNPNGQFIGKHRKIKPTAAERIIWGEGAGDDIRVYQTEIGRIGGLICWENYMPLARMALYQQGVELYLAPTADQRDNWQATMQHIALEGRCFVVGCNQFVTRAMYPEFLQSEIPSEQKILSRGGSVVFNPLGQIIAGPIFNREELIFADINLSQIIQGKMDFDVVGHYARPDLFGFNYYKK